MYRYEYSDWNTLICKGCYPRWLKHFKGIKNSLLIDDWYLPTGDTSFSLKMDSRVAFRHFFYQKVFSFTCSWFKVWEKRKMFIKSVSFSQKDNNSINPAVKATKAVAPNNRSHDRPWITVIFLNGPGGIMATWLNLFLIALKLTRCWVEKKVHWSSGIISKLSAEW